MGFKFDIQELEDIQKLIKSTPQAWKKSPQKC